MANTVTLNTTIVRNPEMVTAKVDDEIVMLSIEKGNYYGLGDPGTRIWELLEQPCLVSALCAQLVEEFEVDLDTCQTQVLEFLNRLVEEGLAKEVSG
jgi:hypothetical protein